MKNWNDFSLPLHITQTDEYLKAFNKKVDYYYNQLNLLTSMSSLSKFKKEFTASLKKLKNQQKLIGNAFNYYLKGRQQKSIEIVHKIIKDNKDILIHPIKKAYAFKGNSMYVDFEEELDELYLVRGRIVEPHKELPAEEMLHIPLNMRENVDTYRYSIPGVPGLYLSQNSYILWNELRNPSLDQLTISNFDLKELLNENIIDLSYYIELFYDALEHVETYQLLDKQILSTIKTLRVIPLVIACSVVYDNNSNRKFKVEYLFPQLLMQYLNSKCIGIAYRSTRIQKGNLTSANLAIPILDFVSRKKYGNIIKKIKVSDSLNIGYFNSFVFGNSELGILKKGNGPSAKSRGYVFSFNNLSSYFSFNTILPVLPAPTYDNMVNYAHSLFYYFDEYLLFLKEVKNISF
ncbi:MAG: hypothetical protein K2M08_00040 [Anaeroplasmataceae bacterium]|nr:hypothetical protein [Anaeroplasmataceae bacterium]